MNRIFGFKHKYPQSFLDALAKRWGFEWTHVPCTTVPKEDISVNPLPLPSGIIYHMELKNE